MSGLKSLYSSNPEKVTIRPSPSVMFEAYHRPRLVSSMRVHCSVKGLKMWHSVVPSGGSSVPIWPPVTSKRPSAKKLCPEHAGVHVPGGGTSFKTSVTGSNTYAWTPGTPCSAEYNRTFPVGSSEACMAINGNENGCVHAPLVEGSLP